MSMVFERETSKGFVQLLSLSGGRDWKGRMIPPKHTLCVAEYGKGIAHYELTGSEQVDVILEMYRK